MRRPTVSASDDDMLAGAEHVAALIGGLAHWLRPVGKATQRLRGAGGDGHRGGRSAGSLSLPGEGEAEYRVLISVDRKFLNLTADANPGAATLALLKIST